MLTPGMVLEGTWGETSIMYELLAIWPGPAPACVRALQSFDVTVCAELRTEEAMTADMVLFNVAPSADALAHLHELRAEAPVAVVLAGEGAAEHAVHLEELDLDGFVDVRWPPHLIDASLVAIACHVNLGRNVTLIQQKILQEARVEADTLYHQAVHDALTGLYNRRYLDDVLPREHARAHRTGSSYAVIILDIDDLKGINGRHGHRAGSTVLASIGSLVLANVRLTDYGFRYGGDEFVILLTHADERGALRLAEQLVEAVDNQALIHDGAPLPFSVSAGLASFPADARTTEALFERADAALFAAKAAGKRRVAAASDLREVGRAHGLANR